MLLLKDQVVQQVTRRKVTNLVVDLRDQPILDLKVLRVLLFRDLRAQVVHKDLLVTMDQKVQKDPQDLKGLKDSRDTKV